MCRQARIQESADALPSSAVTRQLAHVRSAFTLAALEQAARLLLEERRLRMLNNWRVTQVSRVWGPVHARARGPWRSPTLWHTRLLTGAQLQNCGVRFSRPRARDECLGDYLGAELDQLHMSIE
jgi:hypothetical protein